MRAYVSGKPLEESAGGGPAVISPRFSPCGASVALPAGSTPPSASSARMSSAFIWPAGLVVPSLVWRTALGFGRSAAARSARRCAVRFPLAVPVIVRLLLAAHEREVPEGVVVHHPRLCVGPRQAGEHVAKQGGHGETAGSSSRRGRISRLHDDSCAFWRRNGGRGEGFLVERGACARASSERCARPAARRENVKRANARDRARESEATRERAGARRAFSTSA